MSALTEVKRWMIEKGISATQLGLRIRVSQKYMSLFMREEGMLEPRALAEIAALMEQPGIDSTLLSEWDVVKEARKNGGYKPAELRELRKVDELDQGLPVRLKTGPKPKKPEEPDDPRIKDALAKLTEIELNGITDLPRIISEKLKEPSAAPVLASQVKLLLTTTVPQVRRATIDSLLDRLCGKPAVQAAVEEDVDKVQDEELVAALQRISGSGSAKLQIVDSENK